jgi:histidine ammonia-lyase
MTIRLNGSDLTVTQVMAVARHGEAVALAPVAVGAMRRARAVVQDVLAGGEPVYGLTTGVGERKAFLLDPAERRQFNLRLVLNHRIAQGDAAPADMVRGAMLIAIADADALLSVFDVAGALDLEAFGANLNCLHPVIEQTRPFPGLASTLRQLRLLAGSYLWQPGAAGSCRIR